MRCQRFLLTLLLLTLLPATLTAWFIVPVAADTLLVPQQYPTIQAAVNAAGNGDIIEVDAGIYPENVVVNKTVTINGDSATNTIVDSGGEDTVFNILEDNVELCNLTIRNGGSYSGVTIYYPYDGLTIRNTRIIDNTVGVVISDADGNTIEDNVFINNQMYGIDVIESSNTIIRNNQISESAFGIEISDTSSSQVINNTVSDTSYGIYVPYSNNGNISANTLTSNSWNIYLTYSNSNIIGYNNILGGAVGCQLMYSEDNTVSDNTVDGSSYGIYLGYCGANTVSTNILSQTDWGLDLYNSAGSTIIENFMLENSWGAWIAADSDGNSIYHNNFIDNAKGAFQDLTSTNAWASPVPYRGNYWSDYIGADTDDDGTGDTFVPWEGVDWHPLMEPYGVFHDVAVISVTPSDTEAYVGEIVNITVVAENQGTFTETFNVTVTYENITEAIFGTIGTEENVTVAPAQNVTLTFSWNTTDMQPCVEHTIKAEATTVPGEIQTSDNTFIGENVKVKMIGDVNGDGVIDILDLNAAGKADGPYAGNPEFNPEVDFNKDDHIDIRDILVISRNFGKTC
ncbi:MAG: right-handed parallel beta-helix repeat-containing protein [Candidatus Bathyarchaeota archaeon]|nr:MAG: right-handed parallel beta-helix repeat-containing protein [Candidatus Bathyarchaeota archaeon]